jgi:hypothetical protein
MRDAVKPQLREQIPAEAIRAALEMASFQNSFGTACGTDS